MLPGNGTISVPRDWVMRFLQECNAALTRVKQRPDWFAAAMDGLRSVRLRRFPYVIHYRIEGETIVVFGVIHGGRDPSSWAGR